jgi:hypothetical protein
MFHYILQPIAALHEVMHVLRHGGRPFRRRACRANRLSGMRLGQTEYAGANGNSSAGR